MKVQVRISKRRIYHDEEIISYPRAQFLMETSLGYHASETKDIKNNGHPNVKGWYRKENRKHNIKGDIQKVVAFHHFIQQQSISYKKTSQAL